MSTRGRIFIEYLLNTGRRAHKAKIAKKITMLLSRAKGKKRGGTGWSLDFMESAVKDESFPPLGSPSPLHHRKISWDRKVASEA